MKKLLISNKTLFISGIIILCMFTILIIKGISYRKMTKQLESDSVNDSTSISNSYYPEGHIYCDLNNDGYLEENSLSNAALKSALSKAIELHSWLKGSSKLSLNTDKVEYYKDGSKSIPYYKVDSKLFNNRDSLINYSNKIFIPTLTEKFTSDYYCNTVSDKTIYVFNDFNDTLYELGGNIISNLNFDYTDYKHAKKNYSFGVRNNRKIVIRLQIWFNSDVTDTDSDNYDKKVSYEYILERDKKNAWHFCDFYSPIDLCNDSIESKEHE